MELIKSKLKCKIDSVGEQLSFKVENLFRSNNDVKAIYKSEVLREEDRDYQFIMRSLSNVANSPKIHHMFKIVPADQIGMLKTRGSPLYLHGVKSHRVENVMKFGYT